MQFSMTYPDLKNFLLASFSLFTEDLLYNKAIETSMVISKDAKNKANFSLAHIFFTSERLNFDHDVLSTK